MSNIVFFGQADAGKSTLAGYLVSRYDERYKLSRVIDSMKRYQINCDRRLTFSAIINTNRDEVESSQHLNSKSIHLRRINFSFGRVTIIDTPGSENYRKQRERGMFYGNVGIFFMEINNVLDHKYMIETIAPIALWSKLENKRMIFLLTKFDMVGYSEEAYVNALREINDICACFGLDSIYTVIPVAIEVDRIKDLRPEALDSTDLGENICSKSVKMSWFTGLCLVDTIKREIDELDKIGEDTPLIFCVTDQVDRPNSQAGKVWNVKILSGIMRINQEICLAPVKDINNRFRVLIAKVKQLREDLSRYDCEDKVDIARPGEIYGLDIKHCFIDRHHVSKNDYNAIASTCGFSPNTEFAMSDFFSFEIKETDFTNFRVGEEKQLVWFGRSLPFIVREKSGVIVRVQLKSTQIAFPMKYVAQTILIKGQGMQDFYNAKLLEIG